MTTALLFVTASCCRFRTNRFFITDLWRCQLNLRNLILIFKSCRNNLQLLFADSFYQTLTVFYIIFTKHGFVFFHNLCQCLWKLFFILLVINNNALYRIRYCKFNRIELNRLHLCGNGISGWKSVQLRNGSDIACHNAVHRCIFFSAYLINSANLCFHIVRRIKNHAVRF